MAKIPAFISTARLDTGNVVQYPDGSPMGRALEQAGQVAGQIADVAVQESQRQKATAERAQQQQEKDDNFELTKAQQLLDEQLAGDLQKASETMPANARGFHDGFVGQLDTQGNPLKPGAIDERIKKVREGLPPSVQPRFDQSVPLYREKYSNAAAKVEYDGRQNYYRVETTKMLGTFENSIAQSDPNDPRAFENFRAQGEKVINDTDLSALERDQLRTKWRSTAGEAVWKALVAKDPGAARNALGLGPKPQAGGKASPRGGMANEEETYRFFIGKGYTPQQAAGIVGNLIQESGLKGQGASGDGGSAHGIAQWRGDRFVALQTFAKASGKDWHDTQTQLEFIHHELSTTESGAGAKLKAAMTAKQAAEAFIGYERPQGWTPDNPRGGHGWRNRSDNAVRALARHGGKEALAGDYATTAGQDRADPRFQDIPLDRRLVLANFADAELNREQTDAHNQAVADATAQKDKIALGIETGSIVNPSEVLNDRVIDDGDKAVLLRRLNDQNASGIAASQVRDALTTGGYLDATDSGVKKGLNQIFKDSGGGQALMDGTGTALPTTIYAWQKSNVIADDAKQTLQAMTRSPDDKVMVRGLSYLDELQRRNPAAFDANFTEGTAKQVQAYNNLNGYVPANQMAEELRKRSDPEWIKTREPLRKIGEAEANKKYDTAAVVALFDDRGMLNYISSAPDAPKLAGDGAVMAEDFRRLYADAYANTSDSTLAEKNAFTALQRVWGPSSLNGGALTRYPAESYYPTKDMSHDWMKTLLESDLKGLGYVQESISRGGKQETVRPYSVRAVPLTEAQIYAGKLPQYSVVVINPDTGEPDVVADAQGRPMMWPAARDVPKMLQEQAAAFQKKQSEQRIQYDVTGAANKKLMQNEMQPLANPNLQ